MTLSSFSSLSPVSLAHHPALLLCFALPFFCCAAGGGVCVWVHTTQSGVHTLPTGYISSRLGLPWPHPLPPSLALPQWTRSNKKRRSHGVYPPTRPLLPNIGQNAQRLEVERLGVWRKDGKRNGGGTTVYGHTVDDTCFSFSRYPYRFLPHLTLLPAAQHSSDQSVSQRQFRPRAK